MGRQLGRIGLVALIVVALVITARFYRPAPAAVAPPPAAGAEAAPPAAATVVAAAEDDTILPPPVARIASAPLPPLDAPIADIAGELLGRADAGDSAAQCRLGVELLRCRQMVEQVGGTNQDFALSIATQLAEAGREEDAAAALLVADVDVRRRAYCAQLPPALIARGPELLRAAALAGEPEAMLRYADGANVFGAVGMDYLTTPEFDAWRREAPTLARRALATRHPDAVLLLAAGYGGGDGLFAGLLPDDPAQALAWRLLATRLLGAEANRRLDLGRPLPRPPLDAAERAEAEQLAARWHDEFFAGATYTAGELMDLQLVTQLGVDERLVAAAAPGGLCGVSGSSP